MSSRGERLASWEGRLRPLVRWLPRDLAIRLYSTGRRRFLDHFAVSPPTSGSHGGASAPIVDDALSRRLWGIDFRFPLCNAAGMFKNGEAYEVVAAQGAGAYLAGTTTQLPRPGNRKHGVFQPFAPYPRSGAASNWLGLPNRGHQQVAAHLATLPRYPGLPVGASLSLDPSPQLEAQERLRGLIEGLHLYREAAVDFLEINESCPNTEDDRRGGLDALRHRLRTVSEEFLGQTSQPPVLVKLSCDTRPDDVDGLVEMLIELGFDGINLGNTSVAYDRHRSALSAVEQPLFDRFRQRFGGGLSGRPLKEDSLRLSERAVQRVVALGAEEDFLVWRTGGIEGAEDVRRSLAVGVSLCQWYTGYFEHFARYGHGVYRRLADELRGAA